MCGKNFKKSVKKTDTCRICVTGQLIEKEIMEKYTKQILEQYHITQIVEQNEAYKKYRKLAEYQKEEYSS